MAVFAPNQVGELIVGNAVASETTASTFISSATDREIKVLSKDGTAPATGDPFYVLQKTNGNAAKNLNYEFSDVVQSDKVVTVTLGAHQAAEARVITVTGFTATPRANTTYEVLIRLYDDGGALSTENFRIIPGFYVTGDDITGVTNATIVNGIVTALNQNQRLEGDDNFVFANVGDNSITITEQLKASDPARDIADPVAFDVQAYVRSNNANPVTGNPQNYGGLTVTVTTAGNVGVGTGKGIANYEWFTKGYKYEVYRQTGYPADFQTPYYAQDQTKAYNVINISYYSENVVSGVERQYKSLSIAVEVTAGTPATNAATNSVLADLRTVLGSANVPADLAVA